MCFNFRPSLSWIGLYCGVLMQAMSQQVKSGNGLKLLYKGVINKNSLNFSFIQNGIMPHKKVPTCNYLMWLQYKSLNRED
jgi:hypothetical protein